MMVPEIPAAEGNRGWWCCVLAEGEGRLCGSSPKHTDERVGGRGNPLSTATIDDLSSWTAIDSSQGPGVTQGFLQQSVLGCADEGEEEGGANNGGGGGKTQKNALTSLFAGG